MDKTAAISLLSADPARTGIFVDFDGTLSTIVDHPDDATAVDGAAEVLSSLAKRFALVAVVSGRELENLRGRLPTNGVLLAGAYGRHRSDRGVRRETEGWETVSVAAAAATRDLDGVRVERKGAGVSLHFRAAPEQAERVREIAQVLADEFSLEIRPGRKVYELVVPGPGKGEAIARLIEERELTAVLVAGDDVADDEAFRLVRGLDVRSVLVAVGSDEGPPTLTEEADLVVSGPAELVDVLRELDAAPPTLA